MIRSILTKSMAAGLLLFAHAIPMHAATTTTWTTGAGHWNASAHWQEGAPNGLARAMLRGQSDIVFEGTGTGKIILTESEVTSSP